jgi:DNA gyrase/topoisomerase IV subunit B
MDIEVLTGLQAIRRRPRLHLGDLDAPGLATALVAQAVCHAMDAALDGRCRRLVLDVHADGATIAYDATLPLGMDGDLPEALAFFEALYACHARKHHVEVGDALCTLGLATLTACCAELTMRSGDGQRGLTAAWRHGDRVGWRWAGPATGTEIRFRLDRALLPRLGPVEPARLDVVAWRAAAPELTVVLQHAPS